MAAKTVASKEGNGFTPAEMLALSDEALIDRFQQAAFGYFLETVNPENGLVPDTSRPGSPCSIAVMGFALSAYCVGVERGWIARDKAAALTLTALRFFAQSPQGPQEDATGHKGFFYHFLDMQTGRRVWRCELSVLDTALLLAGVLTAAAYFTAEREAEIPELAELLTRRVDWAWAHNGRATIRHGWRPKRGFIKYGWDGYNEATILYVLALASPTHPSPDGAYEAWTKTYRWEKAYGQELLHSGPLFIDQFSHAWIDFDGIQDAVMRQRGLDYFENSRRATLLHRDYATHNPLGYAGYGADFWGLSAGDGPGAFRQSIGGRRRSFFGYKARGAPHGPDDGTVAPWSWPASMPFAPEICIPALRHLLAHYPHAIRNGRLPSGLNPTLANRRGYGPQGWISEGHYGLDQGISVLMLENFRSKLIWRLLRRSPHIRRGLEKAGFEGGWLAERPSTQS